ncbi:unnamed protein product [Amoebophrya sp. A120]|nr:unnamed protein product [Amoebophrya sp. A120]|eukprot:GSA120T00008860001.1
MQAFVNSNLLQACQQRIYPTHSQLYRSLVKAAMPPVVDLLLAKNKERTPADKTSTSSTASKPVVSAHDKSKSHGPCRLTVIDAACGHGDLAHELAARAENYADNKEHLQLVHSMNVDSYTGIDFDPDAVAAAQEAEQERASKQEQTRSTSPFQNFPCQFHQGDVSHSRCLPFLCTSRPDEQGQLEIQPRSCGRGVSDDSHSPTRHGSTEVLKRAASVVSLFGAHYLEEYALKKFALHSRDVLQELQQKAGQETATTTGSQISGASSTAEDQDGTTTTTPSSSLILALWSPDVSKNCVLSHFLTEVSPLLDLNVRHHKPFSRNYFPHHRKNTEAGAQREVLEDLLLKKLGYASLVWYDKTWTLENQQPLEVRHEVTTPEHLQGILQTERTFGDISALLQAQTPEVEAKAWDCLRFVCEGLIREKNCFLRKPYAIAEAVV